MVGRSFNSPRKEKVDSCHPYVGSEARIPERDDRLWVVRAMATRRYEEGGALTPSESGERRGERGKRERERER